MTDPPCACCECCKAVISDMCRQCYDHCMGHKHDSDLPLLLHDRGAAQ